MGRRDDNLSHGPSDIPLCRHSSCIGRHGDTPTSLVDELVERVGVLPDREVVELLRPLLDHRDVAPLVEYVGERLHQDNGHRQLHFELDGGKLHRTRLPSGPIGNVELEHLARV